MHTLSLLADAYLNNFLLGRTFGLKPNTRLLAVLYFFGTLACHGFIFKPHRFNSFICPAIVSPSTVDIEVPTDNHSIQRGLILITKVIQNLANNILFGKEAFMTMLNKFLTNNIMPVTRFLSEVLVSPMVQCEGPISFYYPT